MSRIAIQPSDDPGYYHIHEDSTHISDSYSGWERTFFEAATPGTRKIALRSAMTMSPDPGGIFDVLLRLVRTGLGGTAGSGRQYVSWVQDIDFIRAIEFLIEHGELDGAVNICAPIPLPNEEFMRLLRQAWGAPIGLPATKWMLAIGAFVLLTETELILKSRRVVPGRLVKAGFQFRFPEWAQAAENLVGCRRQLHTIRCKGKFVLYFESCKIPRENF